MESSQSAPEPSPGGDGDRAVPGAGGAPRSPLGRWAKRFLVSFLSALLALGITEWVIQAYWPVGGCVLGLDEELLFAPIPDTEHIQFMTRQLGGRHVVVKVNSHGFLGPEPDPQRARPRWMVFGDSFVMSENEPYSRSYAAQLAEEWEQQIEVLCAGVTGYGPDQNFLRMQSLLPKYAPDGVILVICSYNDFGDPLRNHLMHFDDAGALVHRKATPAPAEADWFRERLAESHKRGLERLWINYQRLQRWPKPVRPDPTQISDYLRAHREDYEAHVLQGETVAHGMLRDVYDADLAIRPEWPSSQYKQRMMTAILREMQALHDRLGIPLTVVVVPGGIDMDPDSWLRIDTTRFPTYDRTRLCRVATQAAQEAGVRVLNLFEGFDAVAPTQDLYEGPIDPHWNRNGMRLGAELTAEFLAEQGLGPKARER